MFDYNGGNYGGTYHTENGQVMSVALSRLVQASNGGWKPTSASDEVTVFAESENSIVRKVASGLSEFWSGFTSGSPGVGRDFVFDNNNAIGLGIGIWEPGFGAAWDAVRAAPGAYTNGAKVFAKTGGAGLVGLNVALTTYTLVNEYKNGRLDTHSIVNGVVTGIGVGLTAAGLVVSAPAIAIAGAAIGIGYGIAQVSGIDNLIDSKWGFNKKTPK
jgi:hypothetical protein